MRLEAAPHTKNRMGRAPPGWDENPQGPVLDEWARVLEHEARLRGLLLRVQGLGFRGLGF